MSDEILFAAADDDWTCNILKSIISKLKNLK